MTDFLPSPEQRTITGEYDADSVNGLPPRLIEPSPHPAVDLPPPNYNDCKRCGQLYSSLSGTCPWCGG